MDFEVQVLGRFLQFLGLKSYLDRKLSSQMEMSMSCIGHQVSIDPTLYISYCFRCSQVFLERRGSEEKEFEICSKQ